MDELYALGFGILEGYGLTEFGGIVTLRNHHPREYKSVGKPRGDVEIKLSDSPENTGEILIKCKRVMDGYFEQE